MKLRTSIVAIVTGMMLSPLMNASAITVAGGQSCGEWLKHRKNGGWEAIVVQNWLMGYLSGVAMESNKDFLKNAEGESIFLYIDQYCTKNPLERVRGAGDQLASELSKKR